MNTRMADFGKQNQIHVRIMCNVAVLETVRGREHKMLVSYLAEPPEGDDIVKLSVENPDDHTVGRLGNSMNFKATFMC